MLTWSVITKISFQSITALITTPNSHYVYVSNSSSSSISVIRTSDNTVIKTIPLGSKPRDMAATPNGDYVYVAVPREHVITLIEILD